jgi:hypothetical protein
VWTLLWDSSNTWVLEMTRENAVRVTVWQASTFRDKLLLVCVWCKVTEKVEGLCLLELDSFLSVKEGSSHSTVQDYCYIEIVILKYCFCTFSHFLLGFLCGHSSCAHVFMPQFR